MKKRKHRRIVLRRRRKDWLKRRRLKSVRFNKEIRYVFLYAG